MIIMVKTVKKYKPTDMYHGMLVSEIIEYLQKGYTQKQIADMLHITRNTFGEFVNKKLNPTTVYLFTEDE